MEPLKMNPPVDDRREWELPHLKETIELVNPLFAPLSIGGIGISGSDTFIS